MSENIEHEGERFLDSIGYLDRADEPVRLRDGRIIEARDFLDACGEHARPTIETYQNLGTDHPQYKAYRSALRAMVDGYINQHGA